MDEKNLKKIEEKFAGLEKDLHLLQRYETIGYPKVHCKYFDSHRALNGTRSTQLDSTRFVWGRLGVAKQHRSVCTAARQPAQIGLYQLWMCRKGLLPYYNTVQNIHLKNCFSSSFKSSFVKNGRS